MANLKRVAVVVTMPAEIDLANCADVYLELCSAVAPGPAVVIADMSGTTFCDARGIGEIVHARKYAAKAGACLRLVIPDGGVLRVVKLLGLAPVWRPYPTLAAALEHELGREIQTAAAPGASGLQEPGAPQPAQAR